MSLNGPGVATTGRVRRRVAVLSGAAGRSGHTSRWGMATVVGHLALPGDPDALAPVVLTIGAGVPLLGLVVGGVRLALMAIAAIAGAGVVAWRGAPARRDRAFEAGLPEVLEGVARHLRAGGSLAQAIAAVEPEEPPELVEEWRRVVRDMPAKGAVAALDHWAGRGRPSVRLAAAALALAAETGGSPARAVDGVAATLRSRLALADEVRALASQARASAAVIVVAPLAFGALAGATDDRTARFFASPAGTVVLVAGVVLDLVGAAWMARLCRRAS